MKVSIITVCYNSAATIQDSIKSVLSQTYNNIEYIIVDGKSSDKTMNIVEQYKDCIATIISEPDKGIYDAMNKGITAATGDIVGILNSDDFYESNDAVEKIVAGFTENPATDIVFGDVVFVEPSNLNKIVRFYSSKKFRSSKLRFGWMPPHPATFIKNSVYKQYGNYNLSYKIASDYELFVRFLMVHELTFIRINDVIVRMRTGGLSTAGIKSSITLNTEIVKTCRNNGIYTNLFLVLLKIPAKLLELIRN